MKSSFLCIVLLLHLTNEVCKNFKRLQTSSTHHLESSTQLLGSFYWFGDGEFLSGNLGGNTLTILMNINIS